MKPPASSKPKDPWLPAAWDPEDAGAIQALHRGDASSSQQQRALRWIIEGVAQTYEQSFYPANARVTDFIEGRRSVGSQIVKLLNVVMGRQARGDG